MSAPRPALLRIAGTATCVAAVAFALAAVPDATGASASGAAAAAAAHRKAGATRDAGVGGLQLPAPPANEPPETPVPARPPTPTVHTKRLSNGRTVAAWAHPARVTTIYLYPNPRSRRIGRTHLKTEDGFPEVYELLRERTEPSGRDWIEIRVPGRPNGRRGWVAARSLGRTHRTHWRIVVSLRARRLVAYFNGRVQLVAPVGVGKPTSPTPRGRFWIRERFRITDRSNPYWPYALGTSDYSTLTDWPGGGVVGIHGDFDEPALIPGDPSHGCVRMHDADIARLAPRISLGTPVDIV